MYRRHQNWVSLLRFQSEKRADDLCFVYLKDGVTETATLTYSDFDRRVRIVAGALQERGLSGQCALLLYPNDLNFVIAFFGCLYAGVVAVPTPLPRKGHRGQRLASIIRDSRATVVLTTASLLAELGDEARGPRGESPLPREIALLATDDLPEACMDTWRDPEVSGDDLAFLQYTSGSTGTPRGVMVSHRNLLVNSEMSRRGMHPDVDHLVMVGWLPLYHDMGLIGNVMQPLYTGGTVVLMPPMAFVQHPMRWLEAISRYRAHTSGGPNFAYDLCAQKAGQEEHADLDLSSWKVAYNGSEPIRMATLRRFADAFAPNGFRLESFYPCYGMAEATLLVTGGTKAQSPVFMEVDRDHLIAARQARPPGESVETQTLVGCGFARLGLRIAIVDPESGVELPDGHLGEIWISGPSIAHGYWQRPEQSEAIFQARLAGSDEGPFLRTGDLGLKRDGELYIGGRLKDLIIVRGRNYFPHDLELVAERSHAALQPGAGAAFSIPAGDDCADGSERLVIVHEVRRQAIRKLRGDEVIACIREAVSDLYELQVYAVVLILTASIPKTTSGKIRRHACREQFLGGTLRELASWRLADSPTADSPAGAHPAGDAAGDSRDSATGADRAAGTGVGASAALQEWLRERVAERVKLPVQAIDRHTPFRRYGMDSKDAIGLTGDLERHLGRRVAPTLAYDFPTIAQLADFLAGESDPAPVVTGSVASRDATLRSSEPADSIAVIGVGCRFPGANDPGALWQMVRHGVDAIAEIPDSRWDMDAIYDPRPGVAGKSVTRWGGLIDDVDRFDAAFFGISPREAEAMDPQQRLLIEVAWQALENAGLVPRELAGSETGVFVGISSYDYGRMFAGSKEGCQAHFGTGNALSIAANRLSFLWDLRGPSLAIDTACSSSLVAVHQACESLSRGESELAIAGGVNLLLTPDLHVIFSQAGMMATDGRCKTFDAAADGYVRGEGAGVVILERMSEASRRGHRILATIKGSAINQDGRSNGLTAPNGTAQRQVIARALQRANLDPSALGYVECHGTGTALGDPIEVSALKDVLASGRAADNVLRIGSIKSNIGHLEAAAGVAGLIKTVLALMHREIPPTLHVREINPHIDLDGVPLAVARELEPWPEGPDGERWAGVSSFGFGGTNAHVIVGERRAQQSRRADRPQASPASAPDPSPEEQWRTRSPHVLTVSAQSPAALGAAIERYLGFIQSEPELSAADLCYSASTTRSHFSHRVAVVGNTVPELAEQLRAVAGGGGAEREAFVDGDGPSLVWLLTGQGSQYPGMSRELYETHPVYRLAVERCAEMLRDELEKPLLDVMFGVAPCETLVHETAYTQPALFAVEYALARLWRSFGLRPAALFGHSIGEYVAACLAGVFSLADALKLVAARGRLMQSLPRDGEMLCVFASTEMAREALASARGPLSIAAINGPENVVISGHREAMARARSYLDDRGVATRQLTVSHAFHSPLMEPILEQFESVARTVTYAPPSVAVISGVTGELAGDEIASAGYWRRHIIEPVDFVRSMKTLERVAPGVCLEIGPKPALTAMARACLPDLSTTWLDTLRPGQADWAGLMGALRGLYQSGSPVDWRAVHEGSPARRIDLPTYPFQGHRHWPDSSGEPAGGIARTTVGQATGHPLLGRKLPQMAHAPKAHVWEASLGDTELAYLHDHQIGGRAVIPYAAYLEMAVTGARLAFAWQAPRVSGLKLRRPLFLDTGGITRIQTVLTEEHPGAADFRVYGASQASSAAEQRWTIFAQARLRSVAVSPRKGARDDRARTDVLR